MIGIYKITNLINGKCYVGQAVNIKARWNKHKSAYRNTKSKNYEYPLYKAMRKYGLNNFKFEVLEECAKEELNEKEIFYIAKYDAYSRGYNQNAGGNNSPHPIKLDDQIVDQIIIRLKTTNDTNTTLAKEFHVSEGMIRGINSGVYWTRQGESYPLRQTRQRLSQNKAPAPKPKPCQHDDKKERQQHQLLKPTKEPRQHIVRPPKLELAKMIVESSFVKVGKHFGVSDNAIKKWCRDYEMPTKKAELVDWYRQNVEFIEDAIVQKATYNTKRAVQQIDQETGEVLATFDSVGAACVAVGCKSVSNISYVCRGIFKSCHGYGWQYA